MSINTFDQLVKQSNIIKSIQIDNLSEISKIQLAPIVALTLDLMNDDTDGINPKTNAELHKLIYELECLWNQQYKKYFVPHTDFYPRYDDEKPCVSFLTYLNEPVGSYLMQDDIKVKILVLTNFIKTFNDYKNLKYLSSVDLNKLIFDLSKWKKLLILC